MEPVMSLRKNTYHGLSCELRKYIYWQQVLIRILYVLFNIASDHMSITTRGVNEPTSEAMPSEDKIYILYCLATVEANISPIQVDQQLVTQNWPRCVPAVVACVGTHNSTIAPDGCAEACHAWVVKFLFNNENEGINSNQWRNAVLKRPG